MNGVVFARNFRATKYRITFFIQHLSVHLRYSSHKGYKMGVYIIDLDPWFLLATYLHD